MKTTTKQRLPEMFISVGKNRTKVHKNNVVFLEKNQEFELEFFNPTEDSVLAKIYFNNHLISDQGVVLRPGERDWLERYINENKKFFFETYFVDDTLSDVKSAIKKNGNIKVEFYQECYINNKTSGGVYDICKVRPYITEPYRIRPYITEPYWAKPYTTEPYWEWIPTTITYNSNDGGDNVSVSNDTSFKHCCSTYTGGHIKTETGRICGKNKSSQDLNEVNESFSTIPFHSVEYKLLPISEKPKTLSEIKLRCENCNTKIKKGWSVCPVCATPIVKNKKC
jgi:hypothetical protein